MGGEREKGDGAREGSIRQALCLAAGLKFGKSNVHEF